MKRKKKGENIPQKRERKKEGIHNRDVPLISSKKKKKKKNLLEGRRKERINKINKEIAKNIYRLRQNPFFSPPFGPATLLSLLSLCLEDSLKVEFVEKGIKTYGKGGEVRKKRKGKKREKRKKKKQRERNQYLLGNEKGNPEKQLNHTHNTYS